jgi:hypothetical protein
MEEAPKKDKEAGSDASSVDEDKIKAVMAKNREKMKEKEEEKPKVAEKDSEDSDKEEKKETTEPVLKNKLLRLTKTDDSKRGSVVTQEAMLEEILMKRVIIFGEVRADKQVI